MDDRGRLAQSLTRKDQWVSTYPGRWRRVVRRWFTTIIELDPPRGLGAAAAVALMLGSAGYGLARGGHAPELMTQLQQLCDGVSNGVGLRIASVALGGQMQLTREQVLDLAGVTGHSSLVCLDAGATRARLKANPWIADATVLKLYPGRLQIDITERRALALWQKDGIVNVIAADGTVLEPFPGSRFAALPLVVGAGADRAAQEFLALLARYPGIRDATEAAVLVANRRWNLHLKNGIDVRLPEFDTEPALQRLVALDRDKKLLSRDIVAIDLRLPDRVTVRLSDEAAAARAEALKDKKPKRKGNDA